MIQKYSRYKLLEIFFRFPRTGFMERELSRMINLAQPSVHNHLLELKKDDLIKKIDNKPYPKFIANRDDETFKLLKTQNLVFVMHKSGFINYLTEKIMPKCMILFGSASKGEDIEQSDIDVFIESVDENIELHKYEKIFGRKINLYFSKNISELSKELKNNIINGIKIYGNISLK